MKALEHLADGYRTVFIMYFFQNMKHAEIGKILGVTAETSRSQYARAKEKPICSCKREVKTGFIPKNGVEF